MTSDSYLRMSCNNCESIFSIEYMDDNVTGTPEYCPFCGEEIPEEDSSYKDDEEKEDLDEY